MVPDGTRIIGTTETGRATVIALHLDDDPDALLVRSYWVPPARAFADDRSWMIGDGAIRITSFPTWATLPHEYTGSNEQTVAPECGTGFTRRLWHMRCEDILSRC